MLIKLPRKQAHDPEAIKARKAELNAYDAKLLHEFALKRGVDPEGTKKQIVDAIIGVEYESA